MLSTGNDPVSQPYQGSVIPLYYESLVPGAGLEPARPLRAGDFKSPVYTISPPGHFSQLYLLYSFYH